MYKEKKNAKLISVKYINNLTNPGLEKEFKGRVPTISKAMHREMVHNKNANTKK